MSDSVSKWHELQEEEVAKRNRVVGQNGNTGEHYYDNNDEDAELPPQKDVEYTYVFNREAVSTFEDIVDIIDAMGLKFINKVSNLTTEERYLIRKGFFKKEE